MYRTGFYLSNCLFLCFFVATFQKTTDITVTASFCDLVCGKQRMSVVEENFSVKDAEKAKQGKVTGIIVPPPEIRCDNSLFL